ARQRRAPPPPPVAVSRARAPDTSGCTEPARITPTVSSSTSFACSRTLSGIVSHDVVATKCASFSIASPITISVLARSSLGSLVGLHCRRRRLGLSSVSSREGPRRLHYCLITRAEAATAQSLSRRRTL